ncbi:MAG TPA: glycosyltransferase family 4 protein [Pyrinomonadaceae bacterium]|nr:glycosyltransferase family 4 protein [Pyrinomonadaceae bacterium]
MDEEILKVLLLNQCFYPDVVSTAQHLTDLATALSARGHEVTVVTSDRGYDDPTTRFKRRECWNDIDIIRIPSLSFGKQGRWRRAFNFASFLLVCSLRLLILRRFDVVVALTSPPLISFLGALFVKLKGGSFCFWVMDLNPDEAIAAGWLDEKSLTSRVLQRMLNYSFNIAARTVVLDRFMKERVGAKGIDPARIAIVPPWSHDDHVQYSAAGSEKFRRRHGLLEKFVVMYSGNHSPCHPLDTLLDAAHALKDRSELVFCFIGGGSEQVKVREAAAKHGLMNVRCLPYQPLNELASSLSAADLHVVVMGNEFVGIVHPCKVYNIMSIGAPTLYIGPTPSHVTDIASQQQGRFFLTNHGDVDGVVKAVLDATQRRERQPVIAFAKHTLLPQLIDVIEHPVNPANPVILSDRTVTDHAITRS